MTEQLTKKQQELIESNHNLIYKFANKKNLSINEYYDILAIGMCNAAKIFDNNKGVFSTVAFRCMENELNSYWRTINRIGVVPDKMIVSYDEHKNIGDSKIKNSFLNIFSDSNLTHEIAINNVMFMTFVNTLTSKEKYIIWLLTKGLTHTEIAKKMNYSRQNIDNYIKNIYKKYNVYLDNN